MKELDHKEKVKNLDELKEKIQIIELEERLEMVQLISSSEEMEDGNNYCCTGSDASCKADK